MTQVTERPFLRFVGKLWESGEFDPGVGWETSRIARRPACDSCLKLQLLDDAGEVLVEAGVASAAPGCRVQGARGMTGQKIAGYIPLRAGGRSVVLRKNGRTLYRVELAASRPRIAITVFEIDRKRRVHVRWKAEHDRPLWFNVVLIDANKRAIPVAREVRDTDLTITTVDLPGGPGCSLAVLATDGLRSAMVRSERFDLPEHPPLLTIMTPDDGEEIAPNQPISLVGRARDAAGRALPDEHLIWSVDGGEIARGRRIAPAGPFAPGTHRIELAYISGGEAEVYSQVHIRVTEYTPGQLEWRRISASLRSGTETPRGKEVRKEQTRGN